MVKSKENKIKVTQIRSIIGHREKAKRTMRALGFRRMHQSVVHADSPVIRGMISKISFLVEVEEV